ARFYLRRLISGAVSKPRQANSLRNEKRKPHATIGRMFRRRCIALIVAALASAVPLTLCAEQDPWLFETDQGHIHGRRQRDRPTRSEAGNASELRDRRPVT